MKSTAVPPVADEFIAEDLIVDATLRGPDGNPITLTSVETDGLATINTGGTLDSAQVEISTGGVLVLNGEGEIPCNDVEISGNGVFYLNRIYTFPQMHIAANGLLTSTTNAIDLTISTFDLDAGGSISMDGRGYSSQSGTGAGGAPDGGAGHGGEGGLGASGPTGGAAYGAVSTPTTPGSGGGGATGGAGGGAIRINAGTLTLNGTISADAEHGTASGGGGAGGSIYISAGTLSGSGELTAHGGNGADANAGGGAGGRIRIGPVDSFTGSISACGGTGFQAGGAGTVLTQLSTQTYGDLSVDNCGNVGAWTPIGTDWFDNTVITGGATVTSVQAGETVLQTVGDLTVEALGAITVTGRGDGPSEGSGAGTDSANYGGGGALAGAGGQATDGTPGGNPHGVATTTPNGRGSGGGNGTLDGAFGGAGGGIMRLEVGGVLTLLGDLLADGADGQTVNTSYGGGGSGGSISITAATITGDGMISAAGGAGASGQAGGGGGGQIGVTCDQDLFSGAIDACGGTGAEPGGAGTVYWHETTATRGDLLIDNCGQVGPRTGLTSGSLTVARADVLNGADTLELSDSAHLTVDEELVCPQLDLLGSAGQLTLAGTCSDADVRVSGGVLYVGAGAALSPAALEVISNGSAQIDGVVTMTDLGLLVDASDLTIGDTGSLTCGDLDLLAAATCIVSGNANTGRITANDSDLSVDVLGELHTTAAGTGMDLSVGSVCFIAGLATLTGVDVHADSSRITIEDGGELQAGNLQLVSGADFEIDGSAQCTSVDVTSSTLDVGTTGTLNGGATTIASSSAYIHGTAILSSLTSSDGGIHVDDSGDLIVGTTDLSGTSATTIDGYADLGAATFTDTAALTVNSGAELYADSLSIYSTTPVSFDAPVTAGYLVLGPGVVVSHPAESTGFDLWVLNDAALAPGAWISADGKGYGSSVGPGGGLDYDAYGSGAGHAGEGGLAGRIVDGEIVHQRAGGSAYGSVTAPIDLGSGGGNANDGGQDALGGRGGGVLLIRVDGTLTNNGYITANGEPGSFVADTYFGGGGSGGSVVLQLGTLYGSGIIAANGGSGNGYQAGDSGFGSGGGSAGRMALYVANYEFQGTLMAQGGDGYGGGAGGTIVPFTDPPAQNPSYGGDPVLLNSGELYLTATDIEIPARGIPIVITRTYRSLITANSYFGHGWDFNFNVRLKELDDGTAVIGTGTGVQAGYPFAEGAYRSPPGRYMALIKNGDDTWTLTDKHQARTEFDTQGRMAAMVDRNGNTVTYGYTGDLLTSITDATNRTITLAYTNDLLTSITDWAGRTWTYEYDPVTDDLLVVTAPPTPDFPSGTTTTYGYDARHHLTSVTDGAGQTYLTNQYDDVGRVEIQTDADNTLTFVYDPENQTTTVTDSRGVITITEYNNAGNPTAISVSGGDPNDPGTYTTLHEYNVEMDRTRTVLPRGNEELMTYDELGNVLSHTRVAVPGFSDPDIVTSYTYEPTFSFVETMTDPRENVTTYAYDPTNGDLLSITQPMVGGQVPVRSFTYNAFGQVETETDPEGLVTYNEYDPATGYLLRTTRNYGGDPNETAVTEFTYDSVGNLATLMDAEQQLTAFDFNDQNQLVERVDALDHVTLFSYDGAGNLAQIDRQNGDAADGWQTTTYTYNLRNQVETVTDDMSHVTTYGYDPAGNLTSVLDAEQNLTTYEYDKRDLLVKTIDALTHEVIRTYDDNGNLASLTDQNTNTTAFAYDGFDRLQTMTYPDTSTEVRAYDPAGNLTGFTNRRGQLLSYTYDALNRRETKTTPDYGLATLTYDQVGRLLTINDVNGLLTNVYDDLGRLEQVTDTFSKVVNYEYDRVSNRTRLVYPEGYAIDYEYDPLNRLSVARDPDAPPVADLNGDLIVDSADMEYLFVGLNGPDVPPNPSYENADLDDDGDADLADVAVFQAAFGDDTAQAVATYSYDDLSRRVSVTYANGTSAAYTYDDADRLLNLSHDAPAIDLTYDYTYDDVDNRISMTVGGSDVHGYTYDDIYRLTHVDYPTAPDVTYNYDPAGNRLSVINGGTVSYTLNNLNQYADVDGVPYTYDGSGNLTGDGANTYVYDAENRLVSATTSSVTATYTYDARGRRIAKTVDGVTTRYVYDGRQVLAEYNHTDQLLQKYVLGSRLDELVRLDVADTPGGLTFTSYFYHSDALGSVIALTDAAGAVVEAYAYDVFGTPDMLSAVGNPYYFTGRRHDDETGLYYYRARHYFPLLGRFTQPDPLGYADDANLYTYVRNNPVNYRDPLGTERTSIWLSPFLASYSGVTPRPEYVGDPYFLIPEDVGDPYYVTPRPEEVGNPYFLAGSGRSSGGACGATGLEAAPLLLWMAWMKRRASRKSGAQRHQVRLSE